MISIPFTGSKRNCYKRVKELVLSGEYDTVLEPFGGSGVLSVNLYNDGIVDRAIINDYDKLFDIYEEFLDIKDWVVSECYKRGLHRMNTDKNGHYKLIDGERVYVDNMCLPKEEREILQSVIAQVDKKWWRLLTLGTNFCHSIIQTHRKINLTDFTIFNRHLETDKQREYLAVVNQIERDSLDWKDFLEKYKTLYNKKTIIIADPPYINTKQHQYKSGMDTEETIKLLDTLWATGCDFIFFNHELDIANNWLKENNLQAQFFEIKKPVNLESKSKHHKEVMVFVMNDNIKGGGTKRTDYLLHVRRSDGFKND